MATSDPFAQASKFFGGAFNSLERAANMQEELQGNGEEDTRYGANYDSEYLSGVVQPKTGPYGQENAASPVVDQVKEDLLNQARQKRPSNGSLVIRAGGGYNPAVKQ